MTFAGGAESSTGSTITFTDKNGTYIFTVTTPTGYTATPSSGSLTVSGRAVTQSVTFTKTSSTITYAVTFTESGLPSGTSWSVSLNGNAQTSTTEGVTFHEVNGSYSYSVGALSGYTTTSPSGTFKVNGAAVSQPIPFTSSSSKGKTNQTTGFLGLPGYEGFILIGVVVAAVLAAIAILTLRKRGSVPATSELKEEQKKDDGSEENKEPVKGKAEKESSPEPEKKERPRWIAHKGTLFVMSEQHAEERPSLISNWRG